MTNSPLDGPPADDLARAFELPEYVQQDDELTALYHTLVGRLRREAAGLPLNTLQQILIERIASFYVQIKYKENHEGFSPNQQKEFNDYWLKLSHEFNTLLQASDAKLREHLLMEVEKTVSQALDLVTVLEDRQRIRRRLTADFAAMGL